MRNKTTIPLLALCLAAFGLQADQIVMKNGYRVTGSIIKKDAKDLTIKTEYFGVVTLPWEQVASVTADKPLNVVIGSGQTVQGTLATAGDKVEVAVAGTKQAVAPAEIKTLRNDAEQKAYLRMLKPGWGELWVINANIGIAGTSGNAKTATFTTPVNAVRITKIGRAVQQECRDRSRMPSSA
eukprot:TRINITY_DN82711_c0_g2_i1.p2 TRINITY_DN82711_c0_g2~~TRINITY_DN82711_c0_g2_i1.p2  ORF type:complete len:182 (+),score=52.99 TRINITY_DN82711_c0_g2_i1:105-650(+)